MFRMKAGLFLLAACLLPAGAARGQAALSVRVSSQEVLVGDPVQVSVLLSGADAEPAGVPAFERPDAAPLAGPSRSQQFFSINGRSVSRIGWDYTAYPAGTGVVSFGTARLDVGGRTLSAAVPDIRVVPPPEQPWVRLTLECDKSEVLVDEAFDAVLGVEVRLPSAEGWRDKPFHPRACPALSVPWLAARPAENAAMRASLSDLLDPYVARGGAGFTVNGLSSDPFASLGGGFPAMPGFGGSLFDRGPLVFAFPRTFVERDGARFARYELRVPMVATDLGETRLAPVRFEGRVVADPPDGTGAVITDPFVALSPPLAVRVVPPPAEGRPASFCGALAASLAAEASLDTQTCRQGDPVELSIKLSGDFVRSTVQAPDPALAEGEYDLVFDSAQTIPVSIDSRFALRHLSLLPSIFSSLCFTNLGTGLGIRGVKKS